MGGAILTWNYIGAGGGLLAVLWLTAPSHFSVFPVRAVLEWEKFPAWPKVPGLTSPDDEKHTHAWAEFFIGGILWVSVPLLLEKWI